MFLYHLVIAIVGIWGLHFRPWLLTPSVALALAMSRVFVLRCDNPHRCCCPAGKFDDLVIEVKPTNQAKNVRKLGLRG